MVELQNEEYAALVVNEDRLQTLIDFVLDDSVLDYEETRLFTSGFKAANYIAHILPGYYENHINALKNKETK